MPRLAIDHRACLRSGQCAYLQPGLFAMNAEGVPVVRVHEIEAAQVPLALDAIEMCPAQAISLSDAK